MLTIGDLLRSLVPAAVRGVRGAQRAPLSAHLHGRVRARVAVHARRLVPRVPGRTDALHHRHTHGPSSPRRAAARRRAPRVRARRLGRGVCARAAAARAAHRRW